LPLFKTKTMAKEVFMELFEVNNRIVLLTISTYYCLTTDCIIVSQVEDRVITYLN